MSRDIQRKRAEVRERLMWSCLYLYRPRRRGSSEMEATILYFFATVP